MLHLRWKKKRKKKQSCQMCYSKFDLQGEKKKKNSRQCAQTNVWIRFFWKALVSHRKKIIRRKIKKYYQLTQIQDQLATRKSDESIRRKCASNSTHLKQINNNAVHFFLENRQNPTNPRTFNITLILTFLSLRDKLLLCEFSFARSCKSLFMSLVQVNL